MHWAQLLGEVVDEYNRTPHEDIGYPPAYLVHGIVSCLSLTDHPETPTKEPRKEAVQDSLSYHAKSKIIYGKKFLSANFAIRESVLSEMRWQPNRRKLATVMKGLYKISKKMSQVNNEIYRYLLSLGRRTNIAHISKLSQFTHQGEGQTYNEELSGDSREEEERPWNVSQTILK